MNSQEINEVLVKQKHFVGVFAADKIPTRLPVGKALIVNTDPSTRPGQHWVALYATASNEGEFFDSFGRPPFTREVISWCQNHFSKSLTYNSSLLQHPLSDSCGRFCIQFVRHRIAGVSFHDFVAHFSSNLHENDNILFMRCGDVARL